MQREGDQSGSCWLGAGLLLECLPLPPPTPRAPHLRKPLCGLCSRSREHMQDLQRKLGESLSLFDGLGHRDCARGVPEGGRGPWPWGVLCFPAVPAADRVWGSWLHGAHGVDTPQPSGPQPWQGATGAAVITDNKEYAMWTAGISGLPLWREADSPSRDTGLVCHLQGFAWP